jgi:lipopolysaccharide transport system permease protein
MTSRRICAKNGWGFPAILELWEFRDLFFLLVQRDIKLKYKQTAVGIAWVVLQPLATALLFSLLFGSFAKFSIPEKTPYLLFAFVGMLVWLLFSQIVQRASNSLLGDARLISKVYFPRLLIPFASVAAMLVDFLVAFCIILILLPIYGVPFTWHMLLIFPFVLAEVLFATGVAVFLAALNIHYRDFIHVIPFMLQLLMYASPLFYSFSLVPEKWQTLFALNPLVGFAESFRFAILGMTTFPTLHLTIALVISFVVFFTGMVVFERLERTFADVI